MDFIMDVILCLTRFNKRKRVRNINKWTLFVVDVTQCLTRFNKTERERECEKIYACFCSW